MLNGCLALGHTNLFIPSTLGGSPYNPDTGLLDMERVKKNLDMATSVYIECVNRSPCGETVIHLFKGADSSSLQLQREHLLVYLKGSRKKKLELKQKEPELYSYFEHISDIRRRHENTWPTFSIPLPSGLLLSKRLSTPTVQCALDFVLGII